MIRAVVLPLALSLVCSFSAYADVHDDFTAFDQKAYDAEHSDVSQRQESQSVVDYCLSGIQDAAVWGTSFFPIIGVNVAKKQIMSRYFPEPIAPVKGKKVKLQTPAKCQTPTCRDIFKGSGKSVVEGVFTGLSTAAGIIPMAPLVSKFQQGIFWFFSLFQSRSVAKATEYQRQWAKTQATYDVNAQMARNIVNGAITNVVSDIPFLGKAIADKDVSRASLIIATTLWRAKALWADVTLSQELVKDSVWSRLDCSLKIPPEWEEAVLMRLQKRDKDFMANEQQYRQVYRAWFANLCSDL